MRQSASLRDTLATELAHPGVTPATRRSPSPAPVVLPHLPLRREAAPPLPVVGAALVAFFACPATELPASVCPSCWHDGREATALRTPELLPSPCSTSCAGLGAELAPPHGRLRRGALEGLATRGALDGDRLALPSRRARFGAVLPIARILGEVAPREPDLTSALHALARLAFEPAHVPTFVAVAPATRAWHLLFRAARGAPHRPCCATARKPSALLGAEACTLRWSAREHGPAVLAGPGCARRVPKHLCRLAAPPGGVAPIRAEPSYSRRFVVYHTTAELTALRGASPGLPRIAALQCAEPTPRPGCCEPNPTLRAGIRPHSSLPMPPRRTGSSSSRPWRPRSSGRSR